MHDHVTGTLGLSTTTALGAHRVLAEALTDAVRDGRTSRNVATLVGAPKKAVARVPSLDSADARTLLLQLATAPAAAASPPTPPGSRNRGTCGSTSRVAGTATIDSPASSSCGVATTAAAAATSSGRAGWCGPTCRARARSQR